MRAFLWNVCLPSTKWYVYWNSSCCRVTQWERAFSFHTGPRPRCHSAPQPLVPAISPGCPSPCASRGWGGHTRKSSSSSRPSQRSALSSGTFPLALANAGGNEKKEKGLGASLHGKSMNQRRRGLSPGFQGSEPLGAGAGRMLGAEDKCQWHVGKGQRQSSSWAQQCWGSVPWEEGREGRRCLLWSQ